MAQPAVNRIHQPVQSAALATGAGNKGEQIPDNSTSSAPDSSGTATVISKSASTFSERPAYFDQSLNDAERLLKYAAEIGIDVDADTRDHILEARAANGTGWSKDIAANLLMALTKVAASVKPVTAESLKACSDDTGHTVHSYWLVSVCLAIFIVPFSLASFLSTAISTAIRTDITTANELAVKLRAQLGPAPSQATTATNANTAAKPLSPLPPGLNEADVITELQQYASTIRDIDARARQLNVLVFNAQWDPFASIRKNYQKIRDKFELPQGLTDFATAADDRTMVYQEVRYFAQSILDDVSFFYGAMTTCLLPVLYALLGTCAYLLRNFEQQMSARTFIPSRANPARFLIAAIGGAVVGLFNNFTITQGASIPPLAFAFLIGYAVDVFFSFLEGLLQSFTRNRGSEGAPAMTANNS
jgi:hypothetical protein